MQAGTRIADRYELTYPIGSGGMGHRRGKAKRAGASHAACGCAQEKAAVHDYAPLRIAGAGVSTRNQSTSIAPSALLRLNVKTPGRDPFHQENRASGRASPIC